MKDRWRRTKEEKYYEKRSKETDREGVTQEMGQIERDRKRQTLVDKDRDELENDKRRKKEIAKE